MLKLRVLDLKAPKLTMFRFNFCILLVYDGLPFKIFSNHTRNGRNSQNLLCQMNMVKDGSDDWYRLNIEQELQQ